MSLKIFFSSSTGALADRLAADIRLFFGDVAEGRSAFDIIRPLKIIVPNRNMEKWLRFSLARARSVSFNLEFPYLENGLWELVDSLSGQPGHDAASGPVAAGRAIPMESTALASRIAGTLLRDSLDSRRPPSVLVNYCLTGGEPGSPGFCTRLWQLSERLARLFREYEFSRTAMVREWLAGRDGGKPHAMRDAQARLYRQVCGDPAAWDVMEDARRRSLFQVGEGAFGRGAPDLLQTAGEQPVFIFGMTSLSACHCRLIWEVSRRRDVRMYHVNNCHEFWEDVRTPAEDRWARIVTASVARDALGEELDLGGVLDDNPLLKAWGKAGRETVKLLAQMENAGDAETEWVGEPGPLPERATVLERVQQSIRARTTDVGRVAADDSIEVWNCPGKLREVETIAERIVALLAADRTLKLSQIAILVSDMAAYKPLISQVFDRDKGENGHFEGPFPYNLADSTAASDSLYAQAAGTLIDMASGDLPRRQVFDLLYNPCFQAATGLSPAVVDAFAAVVDRLGAFRDTGSASGPVPSPFSWDLALMRIRLGMAMTADDDRVPSGDTDNPFDRVYPSDAGGVWRQDIESVSTTLETLFARLRSIGVREDSAAGWYDCLTGLFETFLAVPADRGGEVIVRDAFVEGLSGYFSPRSPLDCAMAPGGFAGRIPAALALEIARGIPGNIPTCRGAYLSDGMTVASIKPMRPIPFRVIFIAGLEEGAFPAPVRESSLDLRFPGRMIGDITSADAGRYMFLETLMATSEKLILTYDGWDTKKDATHEPCSVVRQLEDFIRDFVILPARGAPGEGENGFVEKRVQISPFGEGFLYGRGSIEPAARRLNDRIVACMVEASRRKAGGELAGHLTAALARTRPQDVRERDLLGRALSVLSGKGETRPEGADPMKTDGPVAVRIRQLAEFLEDPMKARLKRVFDVWGQDADDPAVESDEPFAVGHLDSAIIVADLLRRVVSGELAADALVDGLRGACEMRHLRSAAPQQPFRGIFVDAWEPDLSRAAPAIADVVGARAVTSNLPDSHLDLQVDGVDFTVGLDDGVDFILEPGGGHPAGYVKVKASSSLSAKFSSALLAPFLYAAAVIARDGARAATETREIIEISGSDGAKVFTLALDGETARAYLVELIRDYLDDSALLENLPYETACGVVGDKGRKGAVAYPPDDAGVAKARESIQNLLTPGGWSSYYPLTAQRLLADCTEPPPKIGETIRRRYGLFWSCVYGESKGAGKK